MKKTFVPREKMSKKARKEQDAQRRAAWAIKPTARIAESKKIYNRKKAIRVFDDNGGSFLFA